MKASLARKQAARARYQEHMAAQGPALRSETDYTKWDLFTPEDEEDEMVNSLTPNDPGIRALERDINERHQRWAGSTGQAGGVASETSPEECMQH